MFQILTLMATELQPKPTDRIICVKVGKVERENLYEMARKYWVMKLERASKATHVLAIVDGYVKAVYLPEEWFYSKDYGKENRIEFVGKEAASSEYLGKYVQNYYGHSANPVKYINM